MSARGFTLVELLVTLAILAVISAIAIPRLMEARLAANEASAISSVRTISTAQRTFASTQGTGLFADQLSDLVEAGFIDEALGSGEKDGYRFEMTGAGPDGFTVTAAPLSSRTGRRHLFCDESGVIRYAVGEPADSGSMPLGGN